MLLTLEQFNQRLDSENNLINSTAEANPSDVCVAPSEVEEELLSASEDSSSSTKIVKWGGSSTKERIHYKLSEEQRVTIGSLGRVFPTKDVAELTGVSQDAVRDLRNGKKGSSGYDANLNEAINKATLAKKQTIQDIAMEKLLKTLGFISEDKLEKGSAKDLSSVAANLSKVHSNLEPKVATSDGSPRVQVILFQPKPLSESHFEVVDV